MSKYAMGFPPAPASAPYEIEAPLGSGAGVVNTQP